LIILIIAVVSVSGVSLFKAAKKRTRLRNDLNAFEG
jgi:hypothetical protein